MDLWKVVGAVGGIANVFTILLGYFFYNFSTINFKINAINEFYMVKTKDKQSEDVHKAFTINFC